MLVALGSEQTTTYLPDGSRPFTGSPFAYADRFQLVGFF
jgi:hypothetical protein